MRIVSLIPGGTDLICALGLQNQLVGVSHECDHPAAQGLPILTSSVIPSGLTPQEIDQQVTEALAQPDANGSLYRTNRELLHELKPDLILTQSICDVCAVNASSVECHLPTGAHMVNLGAVSFATLWDDLRRIADLTGASAEAVIEPLQARLNAVEKLVAPEVAKTGRPRVLTLEWTDPPFVGGHWVPEIVELAGGRDVLGKTGEVSRRATWDEIAATDPDVVLVLPCGFGLEETRQQEQALRALPAYADLGAVRAGRVWLTDATRLFSRCTPASIRAVEVVAGILHPHLFTSPLPHEALCASAKL